MDIGKEKSNAPRRAGNAGEQPEKSGHADIL